MNILKEVLSSTILGSSEAFEEYEKQLSQKKENLKGQSEVKKELPKGVSVKDQGKELNVANLEKPVVVMEKTTLQREPVIEQFIKPKEIIEVQPIITREREQTEVHEVLQPMKTKEILAPLVEEKELPVIEGSVVENREAFEREYEEATEKFKSSVTVGDVERERIVREPVIQEVFHKKIIEEIQPVIHKETIVPRLVKEKQPIKERVIEAPKLVHGDIETHKHADTDNDVEIVKKAPIFEEVIKPREIIEVQPVITRERELTEVHEVLQPMKEKEILPAIIEEKELPLLQRPEVRESSKAFLRDYAETTEEFKSSVVVGEVEQERIVREPVIQEIIHKKIIEEIQPVIHKETIVPHIIRETLPIYEKIVEAPKLIKEELEEKDLGLKIVGADDLQ